MQDNSQKPTTRALLAPLLTPISGTALFALGGAGWLVLTRQMGVDLSPWLGVGLSSSLAYMLLRLTQPRDADGAPTLDDLPEAVFLVDAKGRITQWNQRAETLAGGPIFESGQPYQEIVPEDCRATFEQAVEQGRRTGLFGFETRLSTEDGTSVPCQGRAKPLLGKRGQAQGMTITLRAVGRHQQLAEREAGFRQMVEMAPYLVGIVTEGRISWLNSSGIHMMGAEQPAEVVGRGWDDHHLPADAGNRERLVRLDGSSIEVEITSAPTFFEGQPALIIEARDISSLTSVNASLDDMQAKLRSLMNVIDDSTLIIDPQGMVLACNPAAESMFGRPPREIVGQDMALLMGHGALPAFQSKLAKSNSGGLGPLRKRHNCTGMRRDGSSFPMQLSYAEMLQSGKRMFAVLARDMSERKALHARLTIAEKVMESTSEGIIVADRDLEVLWVNSGFTRISGFSREEAVGQKTNLLKSGLQSPSFYKDMWVAIEASGEWSGEIWNRRKDGEAYPEWLTIKAVMDDNGQLDRYVGVFSDISRHKRAQEAIHHLTYYDPVTRLPNRYLFQDRLGQAQERARRTDRRVAVVLVSLDRFKTFNETLGHQVGDALLREVAQRLTNSVRGEDTVSRLRGDTFCCVLAELNHTHDANPVINRMLEAFAQPFLIQGHELFITASMGISLFPLDGTEIDDLLQKAETAVSRSKERSESAYHFYTPEMNANSMERLRLETDLRKAVNRGELVLYYQPKVDTRDGRLVGAEALVRWRHPEYGMVPPGRFIPIAEDTGLILPIGTTVLHQACRQVKDWIARGLTPVPIAVNLSAHQFRQPDMVESITRALADFEVPPHLIELELTESAVMRNADSAVLVLMELHRRGLHISIDDFGTGYSSLSYLKKFPIDKLKIDRSFVQDLGASQAGEEIVGAIIAMAHSLKMSVIAEGVENSQQLNMLREMGCEQIQGFYFGRPVPAEEFAHFMEQGVLIGKDAV